MSNGISPFERFSKLSIQIGKLVLDGKRDAGQVADILQVILTEKDFHSVLTKSREVPVSLIPADGWAAEYTRFCQEVFGFTVDFTSVEIPTEQLGFGWVVIIPQGMTLNQAWAKCKERFPSYSYLGDDLNKEVPKNDRTSTAAYVKHFRNRVEADEENKNLSASTLAKRKTSNITLLERIILELWYHWRTDQHLDIKNVTLCAGSRGSGGSVPYACWSADGFKVYYCSPGSARGNIRTRSAV